MKTTRTSTNKVVSPKRRASKTKVSTGAQRQSALSSKNGDIARGGVAVPFPWRLHEMLEDSHREGNDWIVSWAPHGRSFTVHKPKIFVEKIMPTYFNQSKYASFQRQLNLYGFNRFTSGKDKGAYYHSCFIRDQQDLCKGMIRQKIKGTKVRRTLSPEEEPNFYSKAAREAQSLDDALTESQKRMETVRQVLAQTEKICEDDFFENDIPGPLVSPAESEESDSEETNEEPLETPDEDTNMPSLDFSDLLQPDVQPHITPDVTTSTIRPHRLSSGDLLFFEGKPFHYLEHLDSLPPPYVRKVPDDNKDSSYDCPRDSLQSLMRANPNALMGAAFKICQVP